jgi:hypothetical protein
MVYPARRSFVRDLKADHGQGAFVDAFDAPCRDGASPNERELANGNVLKLPQTCFFYTIT